MREHGIDGEIIVADNGSIDGSQAIAARRGARARDPSRPTRRSGRLTE
jgi:glycosyltransferase involved in cell wall biosynthesis